jgi:hypothetical protein
VAEKTGRREMKSTLCKNCLYFDALPSPNDWKGSCGIKLPPMMNDFFEGHSRLCRSDYYCDLGQPMNEAEEK